MTKIGNISCDPKYHNFLVAKHMLLALLSFSIMLGCTTNERKFETGNKIRSQTLRVQELVDKARTDARAPGFAAVMVDKDRTMLAVSGVRSLKSKQSVSLTDKWHIGSVSKMMTASLTARLVEKGVLDWDSEIGSLFSDVEPNLHQQYRSANIVHFLSHRSGMRLNTSSFSDRMSNYTLDFLRMNGPAGPVPVGFDNGDFTGNPTIDRRHWTRAALQETPVASLGTNKRIYENGNYVVVAAILEHLTGISYEELMRTEVFDPLAMTGAGFGPPGQNSESKQPHGHSRTEGLVTEFPPNGPRRPDNPPVLSPSGRIHLTLSDMAKFMRAHIAGLRGRDGFLKTETYQRLVRPPFGDNYALGWIVRESGGFGHGGTNGKWLAVLEIRPEEERGAFVVTNLGPPQETSAAANALVSKLFKLEN